MEQKKKPSKKTSMRLDEETQQLLDLLAKHTGGNHTSVIKLAVRKMAREEGIIPVPGSPNGRQVAS